MKISFEAPDKLNGLLTLTVEEADYAADVEKKLKDYRKKANVPGFRQGMVPMGIIKRQFGSSVKMDAVNKLIGAEIYKYIKENKIQMLGDPLPSDKQAPQDLDKEAPYTFMFDIAVAPEFKCELTGRDKIDYYEITVDDALIDRQVESFAARSGKYESVESYQENDTIKGDLRELDDQGNTKEGGLVVEGAILMPSFIKVESQKKHFDGAKTGDIITFNPREAYPDNDTEVSSLLKIERDKVAEHTGNFSLQVTEITHFQKHAVDQALFDSIYGEGVCKDESDFRAKIAEGLKAQLATDSDYKFLQDLRAHCEKKVGKVQYPDALLKRIMLSNNKDKGEAFVEKNYEASVKELTWHLIKEQLVSAHEIKVNDNDVLNAAKEAARAQFAQYGMTNIPDSYVDNYANDLLKKQENVQPFVDRAVDTKLVEVFKGVVKLNPKEISLDEFNKMA